MKEVCIYEVQIKGTHPYPCFTTPVVARQVSVMHNNAPTVERKYIVFDDVADFQIDESQKQMKAILNKLTDEEKKLLKMHWLNQDA